MSKTSYQTLLDEIMAIPDCAIKQPNMPIATFIQEASDLCEWMREDLSQLSTAGIDASMIDHLALQLNALVYAQSICSTRQLSTDKSYQRYQAERKQAESLLDELTAAFRFSFQDAPKLLRQLKRKRNRGGITALIQELYDLSVLGAAHPDKLSRIGFDLKLLEKASTTSKLLSQLHAQVNQLKSHKVNHRKIRNKAYTLLKTSVDQVRLAGKYVFRDHPNRLKGYRSSHWAKK